MQVRSNVRRHIYSTIRTPLTGGRGHGIPGRDYLLGLWEYKNGVATDTIGLSVDDYVNVDESVRDIFFSDESTLRDTDDAYDLAMASPLLNIGTMIGSTEKCLVLYQSDTVTETLFKAMRYLDVIEPFYTVGNEPFYTSDNNQIWVIK